jgi:tetratricopeptide (TPR) repeat protein
LKKSAFIAIIALLLVAIGLAQRAHRSVPYGTSKKAYELYAKGYEEYQSFRWDRADELLRQAVAADSNFAMAYAALANVAGARSQDESKRMFARAESLATRLDDENERMLVQLQLGLGGYGKKDRLDSLVTILGQRLPRHELVISARAILATNERDFAKASEIWHELLKINPNIARAYNWLGYNAAYQGNYDEAERHLRKYVYLAPDLANPHDSLGEVLMQAGRYGEAEAEYLEALRLQPDFVYSLYGLACVYIEQGRVKKGLDIIEQTIAQVANTPLSEHFELQSIRFFLSNDMQNEAQEAMRKYCSRNTDEFRTALYRSVLMIETGQLLTGKTVFDSLLAASLADSAVMKSEEAQKGLERVRTEIEACYAERTNQLDEAIAARARLVGSVADYSPYDQIRYRIAYARVLLKAHAYPQALAEAERILAVNPHFIPALVIKATAAMSLERWDQARETLSTLDAILSQADADHPARSAADNLKSILDRDLES